MFKFLAKNLGVIYNDFMEENAKDKALSAFRQPPLRLNCAQAVAYGLGREDLLEKLSDCGVGRAPNGMCGAVYAAMMIAGVQNADEVVEAFKNKNGSIFCKELKQVHHVPCPQCVVSAIELGEVKR